jgi:hypothetical protein
LEGAGLPLRQDKTSAVAHSLVFEVPAWKAPDCCCDEYRTDDPGRRFRVFQLGRRRTAVATLRQISALWMVISSALEGVGLPLRRELRTAWILPRSGLKGTGLPLRPHEVLHTQFRLGKRRTAVVTPPIPRTTSSGKGRRRTAVAPKRSQFQVGRCRT